jgi:hypothetical protein
MDIQAPAEAGLNPFCAGSRTVSVDEPAQNGQSVVADVSRREAHALV